MEPLETKGEKGIGKLKIAFLLVPLFIPLYSLVIVPVQYLKSKCQPENWHWVLPRCEINFGEALAAQGFSSTLSGEYPDCDNVEKGWCVVEKGETKIIEINGKKYEFQTATVTPKGLNLQF